MSGTRAVVRISEDAMERVRLHAEKREIQLGDAADQIILGDTGEGGSVDLSGLTPESRETVLAYAKERNMEIPVALSNLVKIAGSRRAALARYAEYVNKSKPEKPKRERKPKAEKPAKAPKAKAAKGKGKGKPAKAEPVKRTRKAKPAKAAKGKGRKAKDVAPEQVDLNLPEPSEE